MRNDLLALRREIEMLGRIDPDRYSINAPIAESEVLHFDVLHGIELPTEYREFLLIVGNGGTGPGFGVEKLGQAYGSNWAENPGLVGDLNASFPYTDRWNSELIDTSLPASDQYLRQDEYWSPRRVNGAMPICHYGCNRRGILVVAGPERGNVWVDDRAGWVSIPKSETTENGSPSSIGTELGSKAANRTMAVETLE